jgi:hypothetical protein
LALQSIQDSDGEAIESLLEAVFEDQVSIIKTWFTKFTARRRDEPRSG